MPRKARQMRKGVYYHIIIRGNNRVRLFKRDKDKQYFLNLLELYCRRYEIKIYHYCVMSNHVHMLIKSEAYNDGISKALQGIQMVYARHYKRIKKMTGVVFEGRYKSYAIEDDAYLLECGRYIERNPVRAKLVQSVGQYRWSSYGHYGYGRKDTLVRYDPVYLALSVDQHGRCELYRRYVETGRAYEKIVDQFFDRAAVAYSKYVPFGTVPGMGFKLE